VSNLLPAFEESESSQGIADLREKFDRTQMKLKEMSCQLSKQHELLRAIMQKMEIKAEADDKDDGMTLTTTVCPSTHL
jgi:NADH:ubiquinone oxidoreductase subunit E